MKNLIITILILLLFIIMIGEPVEGMGTIGTIFFWLLKVTSLIILFVLGSRYETDK